MSDHQGARLVLDALPPVSSMNISWTSTHRCRQIPISRMPTSRKRLLALNGICPSCRPLVKARSQCSAEPGSAILRCCLARVSAGVTLAAADMSLFFQPETTSPSPFIIAS